MRCGSAAVILLQSYELTKAVENVELAPVPSGAEIVVLLEVVLAVELAAIFDVELVALLTAELVALLDVELVVLFDELEATTLEVSFAVGAPGAVPAEYV